MPADILRSMLGEGMYVEINIREGNGSNIKIEGAISKILTNSEKHPHGILVELSSGEKGRVTKVLRGDTKVKEATIASTFIEQKKNIQDIISGGENHSVEFKSSMLWSDQLSNEQVNGGNSKEVKVFGRDASKFIIAKSIAGFLNSDGGDLIIGIKENKNDNSDEVIGVESEFLKLRDQCEDGYRRKIIDSIVMPWFPKTISHHINNYIQISFPNIDAKVICWLRIASSDEKVFLNIKNNSYFFVRIDASTRELHNEEVVNYCMKRFT